MNRIVKVGIPFLALAVAASAFAQNAEPSDPACAQRLTPAQIEENIRGYMDECKTVGMAVVMVKGDKVVYQKAFGHPCIEETSSGTQPACQGAGKIQGLSL